MLKTFSFPFFQVENEEHCDFVKLREAVLRTNVDSLRERTHKILYEAYRRERLRAMKVGDGETGPKMLETFAKVILFSILYSFFSPLLIIINH